MSTRQAMNKLPLRRIVPPKPPKAYVKWYMNWADTAHKLVVLTCVGVTAYYGVGVIYMFIQSRKNKGELRQKLIEAGVIDADGRQLLHRLKGEDSWLGDKGIQKRENLAQRIEEKHVAAEMAVIKAEEERLRLERENVDRTRVGIYNPGNETLEGNRRRIEDMKKVEENLDPRVAVFYRGDKKAGSSWFGWLTGKTGEEKQVEAAQEAEATQKAAKST